MSERPPPTSSRQGDGCLAGLLAIAGIVLLLPGLCTHVFWGPDLYKPNVPLPQPVIIIFTIGLAGVGLILAGFAMTVVRFAPPQRNRSTTVLLILVSLVVGIFGLMLVFSAVVKR
jgi:hypothetical protein